MVHHVALPLQVEVADADMMQTRIFNDSEMAMIRVITPYPTRGSVSYRPHDAWYTCACGAHWGRGAVALSATAVGAGIHLGERPMQRLSQLLITHMHLAHPGWLLTTPMHL